MGSMIFLINDNSTGGNTPVIQVTITENADGTVTFDVTQLAGYVGDLRGLFFDIADESLIGSLTATAVADLTEMQQGDDGVTNLGGGSNMNGLLGDDGGYDVGIEIGDSGIKKDDDIRSFSFTLGSGIRPLTLADFSNVSFGARITSVGLDSDLDGTFETSRAGSAKIGETTFTVFTPVDDSASLLEDQTATGNVLANDGNPAELEVLGWSGGALGVATPIAGLENTTITLNADGAYVVDASAADALAQDETVNQTFTYDVLQTTAEGSSTQAASFTVTVTGTNDAPVIDVAASDLAGSVGEDGVVQASGSVVATDVDHGAVLGWTLTGGAVGETTDVVVGNVEYTFAIDQLDVIKNGNNAFFSDGFGDGAPPPSAVNFGNGNPANYNTIGTFTESGGRAIMDGSVAGQTESEVFTSTPFLGHFATLATNISNDLNLGLKNDDDFTVTGRFDLIIPDENRETYGIRLTDRVASGPNAQPGDDAMELVVHRGNDGNLRVTLRERDYAAGETNTIQSTILNAAGAAQIALRLEHDAANVGVVTASFDLIDGGGTIINTVTFANTGQIFGTETPGTTADDELFTRAQIIAFSPGEVVSSSLVGNYGTMTIDQSGGWTYQLNNGSALVQALAEGDVVNDIFTAIVADEFGATDSEDIVVTVTGLNDDPTLAGAAAQTFEDGAAAMIDLSFLGADIDSDDDGSTLSYAIVGGPAEGSASISGTVLTFDPGADFQDLAQGETRDVIIQVQATDSHNAVSNVADITVTVTGQNDAPAIVSNAAVSRTLAEDESTPDLTATGMTFFNDVDLIDTHAIAASLASASLSNGNAISAALDAALQTAITTSLLDAATGDGSGQYQWEFALDNDLVQFLNDGEALTATYNINVADNNNASAMQQVEININGRNDGVLLTFDGPKPGQNYSEDGFVATGYFLSGGSLFNSHVHYSGAAIWGHAGGTDVIRFSRGDGAAFSLEELDVLQTSGLAGLEASNGSFITITGPGHIDLGPGFDNILYVDLNTNDAGHGWSSGSTVIDNMLLS